MSNNKRTPRDELTAAQQAQPKTPTGSPVHKKQRPLGPEVPSIFCQQCPKCLGYCTTEVLFEKRRQVKAGLKQWRCSCHYTHVLKCMSCHLHPLLQSKIHVNTIPVQQLEKGKFLQRKDLIIGNINIM